MKFNRKWAMPNHNTYNIAPIYDLVHYYLSSSKTSIDPFARDSQLCTITNDLNPETSAEYHLDVLEFLLMLKQTEVTADLVLFDPPYSLRQIKEVYQGFGRQLTQKDTQRFAWKEERNAINDILKPDGVVISFGWNSIGMGTKRGFEIIEILLVAHGGAHNDTIVTVERKKREYQLNLFKD